MAPIGLIVVPEAFDARTRVAGLAPLLRHALSLQAGGVAEILIVGHTGELPVSKHLRTRVRAIASGELPGDATAVVIPADVTPHRLLPQRLAAIDVARDRVERVRGTGDAIVFLAGADRVAEVVKAIRDPSAAIDAEEIPLAPREFVLPARDPAERRRAMGAHLESLRKSTNGILDRTIMRPVSLRMTRVLVGTFVTPNHVTFACLVLGLISAYFVTVPGRWALVVAAVLHFVVRFVDCVDGEIARLRYEGSKLGEWFDTIVDIIGIAALLGAAAYRISAADPSWAPIGIFAVASWLVTNLLIFWVSARAGAGGPESVGWDYREAPKGLVDRVVKRIEFVFQIDMISTGYALAIALDRIDVLLIVQSVLGIVTAVFFTVQIVVKPPSLRRDRPK